MKLILNDDFKIRLLIKIYTQIEVTTSLKFEEELKLKLYTRNDGRCHRYSYI